MKYLSIIFLCSISFSNFAETNSNIKSINDEENKRDHPIKTNKIMITGEKPDNWLKFYEYLLNRGQENIIPLIASINFNNVRSLILTDNNAEKNICGQKKPRILLLLSFNKPKKDITKIQTYINKPCLDGRKARFKLTVETIDGQYYTNTSTLTATKKAFGFLHHVNYNEKRNPYLEKNNSSKLKLKTITPGDSPRAWLIVNDYPYPGKITTTPVSIGFNIKNAQTIKIDDINAYNNKCTVNNPINLLNLTFMDPKVEQTKITTHIPTPCLYHDKAKLQLSVKTKSGKKYFKVVTLPRKAVEY